MMPNLPVKPLPDDAVDMAARAVALEIAHHIETMYPEAAKAVAWGSCKRSLAGVVRNNMKRLGRAAENGEMEAEIKKMSAERRKYNDMNKPSKKAHIERDE